MNTKSLKEFALEIESLKKETKLSSYSLAFSLSDDAYDIVDKLKEFSKFDLVDINNSVNDKNIVGVIAERPVASNFMSEIRKNFKAKFPKREDITVLLFTKDYKK